MPVKEPIGSFERGDEIRDVYTPGEATSLRNAGWRPVGEQGPETVTLPPGTQVLSTEATAELVANTDGETVTPETKRSHDKSKESQ